MTQSFNYTILEEAISWIESGQQVALATVVQTWGSSPFQIGSKMIINEKGKFLGSVSGGCVETSVITECLELIKNKKKIIGFSTVLILLSLLGILYSTFYTSYKKPINLGMDFVGGNELRIERVCDAECSNLSPDSVLENLRDISKNKNVLNNFKLQFQNNNK